MVPQSICMKSDFRMTWQHNTFDLMSASQSCEVDPWAFSFERCLVWQDILGLGKHNHGSEFWWENTRSDYFRIILLDFSTNLDLKLLYNMLMTLS